MSGLNTRESVHAALLLLLQSKLGPATGTPAGPGPFVTLTRDLKHWIDVPAEAQPALFMRSEGEARSVVRGQPPRITFEVSLWVYLTVPEDGNASTQLNPLLDSIDAALTPTQGGDATLTLNGLAHHCWVEGETQIFEGNLGTEAVAIVPVKILVT